MSVADLLVPNPYPLNVGAISAPSITTDSLTINASAGVEPMHIVSPPSSVNEIAFVDTGPHDGYVGLNGVEAQPSVFLWGGGAGPGQGAKIGTNGTERFRILNSGIGVNEIATHALVQATGSTIVASRTLDNGQYSPSWVTISGFTGNGTATAFFTRNGNSVSVSLSVLAVQTSAGVNQAAFTLPIPPMANFSASADLIGDATLQSLTVANVTTVSARVGAISGQIDVNAAAIMAGSLKANFTYQIQ